MLQFVKDVEGELEDSDITNLLERIKTGSVISKREYAIRSLELKKYYQKYSFELYFSDTYEIDIAIYLKLTAYYYLRTNQLDKAMGYLSESITLLNKNGVINEILIESYRYLAILLHRKSIFLKSLDSFQSEFVNRLLVLPSKQIPALINSFIRNFVSKSITLRHLFSHKRSSNNSIYAYNLLLILLQEDDLDELVRKEYQNQVIKAIFNNSLSLIYQDIPFENIISNLEYSFHMIEKYPMSDLNVILEIFDIKLRCLFALNRNLETEFFKINNIVFRKYNKSIEQLIDDTHIKDELIQYLLLFRLNLFIKLANNTPIDNASVCKLKEIKLQNTSVFNLLHDSYVISLLLIKNKEDHLDLLVHFRDLCETHSFYDTAFVLTILLQRLTKLKIHEYKIQEFSKMIFCFKETREYLSDDRDPTIILKDFIFKEIKYARAILENLFEYKISSQMRNAEYGKSDYELVPDDIDNSALRKRKKL